MTRSTMGRLLERSWWSALTLLLVLAPQLVFAQGNPFANPEAQTGAIGFLESFKFWVWIAAGAGFLFFVIAYFIQGIFPDLYNSVRGWIMKAIMLVAFFGVALEFIVAQATASQGQ